MPNITKNIILTYKSGDNVCTTQEISIPVNLCEKPNCCVECNEPLFDIIIGTCINSIDNFKTIEYSYNIECIGGDSLDWSNFRYDDYLNLGILLVYDPISLKRYIKIPDASYTTFLSSIKTFKVDYLDCGVVKTLSNTITEDLALLPSCQECNVCLSEDAILTYNALCFAFNTEEEEVSPFDFMLECANGFIIDPNLVTISIPFNSCGISAYLENGRWYIRKNTSCHTINFNITICWESCDESVTVLTSDVLMITEGGDILSYNASTKNYIYLGVPNKLVPSLNVQILDIAHTSTKMWVLNEDLVNNINILREWDITLSPFTATFNQDYTLPSNVYGAGLYADTNTNLICTVVNTFGNQVINELDLTTNTLTPNYAIPTGYLISGDLLLNSTNSSIFASIDNGVGNKALLSMDYSNGSILLQNILPISELIFGMFCVNTSLYLMGELGNLYLYNFTSNTISLDGSAPSNINGASSLKASNNI